MPSTLPTDSALSKVVDTFGYGTYDSPSDSNLHGEDDEGGAGGESLPEGGGSLDPFGPERLISYPQNETSQGKHATISLPGDIDRPPSAPGPGQHVIDSVVPSVAQSELPSDADNPSARSDYYDDMTIGGSDYDNNDNLVSVSDIWPDSDSGAYVSNSLPTSEPNDYYMEDWLQALGNYWSGYIVEDQNVPHGFPSQDFSENVDFPKSNDDTLGGRVLANSQGTGMDNDADKNELYGVHSKAVLTEGSRGWKVKVTANYNGKMLVESGPLSKKEAVGWAEDMVDVWDGNISDYGADYLFTHQPGVRNASGVSHKLAAALADPDFMIVASDGSTFKVSSDSEGIRVSTNINMAEEFTEKFLKKFGKKGITRRAITKFLQESGNGFRQYMASDIIRCLKLSHNILVHDKLDIFPVVLKKEASASFSMNGLRKAFIELEIQNLHNPETAVVFRRCAANITRVIVDLERVNKKNG